MYRQTISQSLSRDGTNVFDEIVKAIENYFNRSVSTVQEIWSPVNIPECSHLYLISNKGRVLSIYSNKLLSPGKVSGGRLAE